MNAARHPLRRVEAVPDAAAERAAQDRADEAALGRLARGEIDALGELYERHHAAVHRFVAQATGGGADAEDIVHNTFLSVPAAARRYDGRAACRPWLLGIAAHLVQRRHRSLARFGRAVAELAGWLRLRPQAAAGPEQSALLSDEVAALQKALTGLSDAKRVVLLMAEIEGLSCGEIAAALDIPVGTVWTRLHHARAELQAALARRGSP